MAMKSRWLAAACLSAFSALLLVPQSQAATQQQRFALIIGNSGYDPQIGALVNPANDVVDLKAKLEGLQFKVRMLKDAGGAEMRAAIAELGTRAGPGDVALFFYGGHGVAVNGRNYLLPTDTPKEFVAGDQDALMARLDDTLIPLDDALAQLQKAKIGIAFLDSCRNTPGEEGRSGGLKFVVGSRSVAFIRGNIKSATSSATAAGTFRAYATDPGNVALDGSGRNSPFMTALLQHITEPGVTIDEMMRRVRRDVIQSTGSRQTPWTEDLLLAAFYMVPPSGDPAQAQGKKPVAKETTSGRTTRPTSARQSPGGNLPPGLGIGAGAGIQ